MHTQFLPPDNSKGERLKGIDLSQKQRDFSHLVFNEQNAGRILQFADVVASLPSIDI